ncbi:MAG: alternative ribosome rescue aminoacyl-tRNA hydrolase ArfB [Gammaproteobacteria bacterium]|nr:alternative ribosome rescue aminoacyl-tRNA hydrolase ArfB [Gammaproteobacteria bacterium]
MLRINNNINIDDKEIEITAIRSQGAGGQNVNKVSSAIHLRFDIKASSLPEIYQQRLLALHDHRITSEGIVIIKAQQSRSQDKNKEAALKRLQALIQKVLVTPKKRKVTKPSKTSQKKRLDRKTLHSKLKDTRKKIID